MTRPHTGRRDDAGYTLLEVLIALSIIGFISLGLVANVGLGARVWERTDRIGNRVAAELALERVLTEHLARAAPIQMSQAGAPQVIFFDGGPRHMRFFSDVDVPTVGGGFYGFEVVLSDDGSNRGAIEFRRGYPSLGEAGPGRATQWDISRVTLGAAAPRFSYYGPVAGGRQSRWQSEWRRRSHLPELVRLELGPPGVDGSANVITLAPALDRAAIRAPVAIIEDYFATLPGS